MQSEPLCGFVRPHAARGVAVCHMGMPKTGSSALQTHFRASSEYLNGQGLAFPFRQADAARMQRGIMLGNAPLLADYPRPRRFRKGYRAVLDSLLGAACPHVLLSSEMLWYSSQDALAKVATYIRSYDLHPVAVIYLRPQTTYLPAIWFTDLLYAGESRSLEDYVAEQIKNESIYYSTRLKKISEAFGRDAVHVRLYDSGALYGSRTETDFAAYLDVTLDPQQAVASGKGANRTPDYDAVEALRALPPRKRLREYAQLVSQPAKLGKGRSPRLPDELHRAVAQIVVQDNAALSREYLPDKPLFCPMV